MATSPRPVLHGRVVLVLAMALAALGTAVAEASAGSLTGAASRMLSHLPESGALLLWGTGLAVASKAVGRKRRPQNK